MASTQDVSSDVAKTAAEKYKQWHILLVESDGNRFVFPEKRYLLKGLSLWVRFFHYEKQGSLGGINLGWTDDCKPSTAEKSQRWRIAHDGQSGQPVQYGQPVAIAWDDHYLRHGHRDIGINLKWSDKPVFEWRILGGQVGAPVERSIKVALWNDTADEPMIQVDRDGPGADVGWPSTRTWREQAIDFAGKEVVDAAKAYLAS